VALCAKVKPNVIVMDLIMPDMDGVSAITEIRKKHSHVQIIALSSFVDEALVEAALNAGAISFLLKNVSAEALASAIRDAHRGKSTLAPEVAQVLVAASQRPPAPEYHLTEREREVLHLLARGKSNTEIAAELNVGISTIKKHVSSILGKLSTTSRTEAVAIAVRQHLVDG
jgi:NarL family two-component system response regulator LiaR